MLAAIVDRLGAVISTVASTASKKPVKPPKPLPRPVTAFERVKAARQRKAHEYITKLVKPAPGKPSMADQGTQQGPTHQK